MELPINIIVTLIILLVLLAILLILVSRGSLNYKDIGEEKIETSGGFTNCQILCYKCCHGPVGYCDDYDVDPTKWRDCGCKLDKTGCD